MCKSCGSICFTFIVYAANQNKINQLRASCQCLHAQMGDLTNSTISLDPNYYFIYIYIKKKNRYLIGQYGPFICCNCTPCRSLELGLNSDLQRAYDFGLWSWAAEHLGELLSLFPSKITLHLVVCIRNLH